MGFACILVGAFIAGLSIGTTLRYKIQKGVKKTLRHNHDRPDTPILMMLTKSRVVMHMPRTGITRIFLHYQ
jgi:hypothetical protein